MNWHIRSLHMTRSCTHVRVTRTPELCLLQTGDTGLCRGDTRPERPRSHRACAISRSERRGGRGLASGAVHVDAWRGLAAEQAENSGWCLLILDISVRPAFLYKTRTLSKREWNKTIPFKIALGSVSKGQGKDVTRPGCAGPG